MKILQKAQLSSGGTMVLVDYGDNFYAYGYEQDMYSSLSFPSNQCGTKEEVKKRCRRIINLCEQHIEKYNKELLKSKHNGWNILIKQNQEKMDILISFEEILTNSN